jgi:hypothetical protein
MNPRQKIGFVYRTEIVRNGVVIERDTAYNVMPAEALNHVLSVLLKGGAQNSSWYIGLYEGNFTPDGTATAATFPASATECTAYAATTRALFNGGSITDASVSDTLNRSEFTMTADKTVYGGFMSSASAKGATSGVLLSAVRFPAPKVLKTSDVLRVVSGLAFASA